MPPAWGAFAAATVLLALVVVALTRLSTAALREAGSPATGGIDGDRSSGDGEQPATTTPSASLADVSFGPLELLANVLVSHGLLAVLVAAAALLAAVPAEALGLDAAALTPWWAAVGLGLGVAGAVANEGLAHLADAAGAGYDEALRAAMAPDSPGGWLLLALVVLPVGAVAEELLFRGALVGALAVGLELSPWLLAAGSSVLFGLAHGAQGRVGVAVTATLGAGLAAAFVLTGSLLAVIVAHYVLNLLEFVVHEGLEW